MGIPLLSHEVRRWGRMSTREELLKRNSFGSVNDNKYLNAMWRKGGNQ